MDPASAIHANAQRRVSRASIEKPTLNTSASQMNTRDGSDTPSPIAASLPASTSQPLAPPVCGRMNVSSSTKTAIAMTNALAPGSISLATRRSAASISPLKSSKSSPSCPCPRSPGTSGRGRLARGRADAGHTQADTLRPPPASCASPARVRRCASTAPSAIRWCGAASVTAVVTMSPGRMSAPVGVKCTSLPSRARPDIRAVRVSLRPSPAPPAARRCGRSARCSLPARSAPEGR